MFTDGACSGNGQKGARASWAAVFPERPDLDCSGPLTGVEQTNNRAEFTAVIEALRTSTGPLHVHTDSQLLVKIATGEWKAKANLDLVKQIVELSKDRVITWTHVRAHTSGTDWSSIWNREADRRAVRALN